jgi:hypothetical protein
VLEGQDCLTDPRYVLLTDDNTFTVHAVDACGAAWTEDLQFDGGTINDGSGYCVAIASELSEGLVEEVDG